MTIAAAVVVTPWRMSSAAAMVPVQEAIGYTGDRVTVMFRNEVSSPPYAPWRTTAPPGASGEHVLSAVQTSPAGDASPSSAPRSVEILQPSSLIITAADPAGATPTTPVTTTFAFANTGPGTAGDLMTPRSS